MGFSGIPLAEQASYTATNFLPAIAKVRQSQNDTKSSLYDALNNVNLDQRKFATSVLQNELTADEQRRQFELTQEAARKAAAASAGSAGGFGLTGGGGAVAGGAPAGAAAKPQTNPLQQDAYNDVRTRVTAKGMTDAGLKSDYQATAKSAGNGNVRDKYKLQFYMQLRPDLFGSVSVNALGNGGQLRY